MTRINQRSKAEMREDLEAAMIGLAFYEIQENENEELIAESKNELDQHIQVEREKNIALIKKGLRQKRINLFFKKTLPRIAKVAASITLIAFIGLTTAVATVRAVRVKVLELLINVEAEYTEIYLKENENKSFFVPAEWNGSYYPSTIPAGFMLDTMISNMPYKVEYKDDQGGMFVFTEATIDCRTNIDTEDAEVKYTFVNGKQTLCAIKNGKVYLVWSENDRYFVLKCTGSELEAIQIAEGVKRIT